MDETQISDKTKSDVKGYPEIVYEDNGLRRIILGDNSVFMIRGLPAVMDGLVFDLDPEIQDEISQDLNPDSRFTNPTSERKKQPGYKTGLTEETKGNLDGVRDDSSPDLSKQIIPTGPPDISTDRSLRLTEAESRLSPNRQIDNASFNESVVDTVIKLSGTSSREDTTAGGRVGDSTREDKPGYHPFNYRVNSGNRSKDAILSPLSRALNVNGIKPLPYTPDLPVSTDNDLRDEIAQIKRLINEDLPKAIYRALAAMKPGNDNRESKERTTDNPPFVQIVGQSAESIEGISGGGINRREYDAESISGNSIHLIREVDYK